MSAFKYFQTKLFMIHLLGLLSIINIGCSNNKRFIDIIEQQNIQHNQCQMKLSKNYAEQINSQTEFRKKEISYTKMITELNEANKRLEYYEKLHKSHETVMHSLNAQQITALATSVGWNMSVLEGKLVTHFRGLKAVVAFNPKNHTLFAHARFKSHGDLRWVNSWNRSKSFTRAYLDTNQDLVLEADINLRAGVTSESIKVWFASLKLAMIAFSQELAQEQQRATSQLSSLKL